MTPQERVLEHLDAINDVCEDVEDPREGVRLAMDAATALGRWAEAEATRLGTTTAEIYNGSAGNLS